MECRTAGRAMDAAVDVHVAAPPHASQGRQNAVSQQAMAASLHVASRRLQPPRRKSGDNLGTQSSTPSTGGDSKRLHCVRPGRKARSTANPILLLHRTRTLRRPHSASSRSSSSALPGSAVASLGAFVVYRSNQSSIPPHPERANGHLAAAAASNSASINNDQANKKGRAAHSVITLIRLSFLAW